jgi:1,4-dihydroxy-2-naphthoyl-CoA hydrolase
LAIWFTAIDLDQVNTRYSRPTIHDVLGIVYTEVGDDFLVAKMPVDERTIQPAGILHGGASCVLAESIGSCAANFCIDRSKYRAVGLDIHTTHIRSVSSGYVIGTAKPVHLGRSTQVWEIRIENEGGKLVSITRLTMFVKDLGA